jgi:hypothetical protein
MQSMVTGSDGQFTVAVDNFLNANDYDTTKTASHKHIFNEVYNMSYAMKVLIRWVSFAYCLLLIAY